MTHLKLQKIQKVILLSSTLTLLQPAYDRVNGIDAQNSIAFWTSTLKCRRSTPCMR